MKVKSISVYVFLNLCFTTTVVVCRTSIYQTAKGTVVGKFVTESGRYLHEFLGIRYAQAPIGHLRFKPPVPVKPWKGRYDATKLPSTCVQGIDTMFPGFRGAEMWNPNTNLSEDCLFLNLWVPATKQFNKAVMVWIYGGGFTSGSSTLAVYNGRRLSANGDVIVVSMQYRVSALGFAAFGDDDMPGNVGLHDQLLALDWVQENIHRFGGDPKNVTIFGESAGSVSVSLHLLSPLSRGRFQRAILQSGTALGNWATLRMKEAEIRTKLLAESVGCPFGEPFSKSKIIQCLRNAPASQLQESYVTQGFNQFPFVPVIDGVFLPEEPTILFERKDFAHVPILTGFNANEGTYFLLYYFPKFFNKTVVVLNKDQFRRAIGIFFKFYPRYPLKMSKFGHEAVHFAYTPWENPDNSTHNRYRIDQATGDLDFSCPVIRWANFYADAGQDVFLYNFRHRSSRNPWFDWMGVMHADEINYVFGEPLQHNLGYTVNEVKLSRLMMRYWSNFAKFGDPNKYFKTTDADWPRYGTEAKQYLKFDISTTKSVAGNIANSPKARECQFWFEYLPDLLQQTMNITEVEQEWKQQFYEWRTKYIVDWKRQYEEFIINKNYCGN